MNHEHDVRGTLHIRIEIDRIGTLLLLSSISIVFRLDIFHPTDGPKIVIFVVRGMNAGNLWLLRRMQQQKERSSTTEERYRDNNNNKTHASTITPEERPVVQN
jgi:hypothetical protein